jgi:Tfp pilus assembly protein PilF
MKMFKLGEVMFKLINALVILFLVLGFSSCSLTSQLESDKVKAVSTLPINESLFTNIEEEIISPEEIFTLNKDQEAEFLAFHKNKLALGGKSHDIVYEFIAEYFSDFTYYGDTLIAKEVYRLRRGNCMSLAILTTALSNLVGLEYDYREVNSLPVFEKHNNLILSGSHVQVLIYDPTFIPGQNIIYFSKPGVVIDYFPQSSNIASKKVSYKSFLAMYYINISSFSLVDGNTDKAFVYAKKAYSIAPDNLTITNLMALLHKRKGDLVTAEKIYEIAKATGGVNINLLSNYQVLLKTVGKYQQAELIEQELEQLDDLNPYRWLEQAMLSEKKTQYRSAERKYLKVIAMAPYVTQAYFGLYDIYLKQKRFSKAKLILEQSLEWVHEVNQRSRYKNKLSQLVKSV